MLLLTEPGLEKHILIERLRHILKRVVLIYSLLLEGSALAVHAHSEVRVLNNVREINLSKLNFSPVAVYKIAQLALIIAHHLRNPV